MLWPITLLLWSPLVLLQLIRLRRGRSCTGTGTGTGTSSSNISSAFGRRTSLVRDRVVHATDRRRGVFEVIVCFHISISTYYSDNS